MKRWSKDEVTILKPKYFTDSWEDICKHFPDRTLKSIKRKCEQLGFSGRNLNGWNTGEINILEKEYSNTLNKKLSKKIGRSENSIQIMARKIGIKKSKDFHWLRKFDPNLENFKVENSDFCYLLGLMMADGTVDEKRNKASIELKESDKNLLNKILEKFGGYVRPTQKKVNDKIYRGFRWHLNGSDVVKEFKKYGLIQNKTFRTVIPSLPKENFKDFVRGYFDGDGSIVNFNTRKYNYNRVVFTGHLRFLNTLKNKIEELGIVSGEYPRKQSKANCYDLNYNRQEEIKKLKKFMYYDSCLCLERKRIIFNNI